jgi:2-dehydro-3-deoxy-D-arabinonate dehydratase
MKIYKTGKGIIINERNRYYLSKETDWDTFINRQQLHRRISQELQTLVEDPTLAITAGTDVQAPIAGQEVWAAGVTYLRSREARKEESKDAQGSDFYQKVYEADRPELFFKAPPYRVAGPGGSVRIRKDSKWNVPEPELTLFVCTAGSIEGYTIGNDMSSRDIEGENPLYLPQAKTYDGSAAIGPCLLVLEQPIAADTRISISIKRNAAVVFAGAIGIEQMKRQHSELADYLLRELTFYNGVYLMTGTGIVPPPDFTLNTDDEIEISIDGIGTLTNTVF